MIRFSRVCPNNVQDEESHYYFMERLSQYLEGCEDVSLTKLDYVMSELSQMMKWLFDREYDVEYDSIRQMSLRCCYVLSSKGSKLDLLDLPSIYEFVSSLMMMLKTCLSHEDNCKSLRLIQILGHLVLSMNDAFLKMIMKIHDVTFLIMWIEQMNDSKLMKLRKMCLALCCTILLNLKKDSELEVFRVFSQVSCFNIERILKEIGEEWNQEEIPKSLDKVISTLFELRCGILLLKVHVPQWTYEQVSTQFKEYSMIFCNNKYVSSLRNQVGYLLVFMLHYFYQEDLCSYYQELYDFCLNTIETNVSLDLLSSSIQILACFIKLSHYFNRMKIHFDLIFDHIVNRLIFYYTSLNSRFFNVLKQITKDSLYLFGTLFEKSPLFIMESTYLPHSNVSIKSRIESTLNLGHLILTTKDYLDYNTIVDYLYFIFHILPFQSEIEHRRLILPYWDTTFWSTFLRLIFNLLEKEIHIDLLNIMIATLVIQWNHYKIDSWFSHLTQVLEMSFSISETYGQKCLHLLYCLWSNEISKKKSSHQSLFSDAIISLLILSISARKKMKGKKKKIPLLSSMNFSLSFK
jgi:hypothetical protein